MISIHAAREGPKSGPRPLDFRRDLKSIVNIIGEAFGPEMDDAGRAALRELRLTAQFGPLLNFFLPAGSRPQDIMDGFVWEETGTVVANVTTQPVPRFPGRYLIANVAVDEAWRGRGIASQLMKMVLDYIAEQGGQWAVLQVRASNAIALGMYQRLSFEPLVVEHRLRVERVPELPAFSLPTGYELRMLCDDDWHAVRYLINRVVPAEARWWAPHRSRYFHEGSSPGWQRALSRWLSLRHKVRWGVFAGEEIMGVLDVDVMQNNGHRIDLLLHPALRQAWSAPLLMHALHYLQMQPARPIHVTLHDYQQAAIDALLALGFESVLVMVNMRKRIRTSNKKRPSL
jgi:ribosomal protein S18 acetylase RimI-like enzyme